MGRSCCTLPLKDDDDNDNKPEWWDAHLVQEEKYNEEENLW
jgi:hypothetical protein